MKQNKKPTIKLQRQIDKFTNIARNFNNSLSIVVEKIDQNQ